MKLIENILYLEFCEIVTAIVKATGKEQANVEIYLRKAKSTGTKCWEFINDTVDRRKVLLKYESLKNEYKVMVIAAYGIPYDYVAKEPIRELVKIDHQAEEYYLSYRYDGDKFLPTEHVKKYVKAASWLKMLQKVNEDKKVIKKQLNLSLDQFWCHVCDIIKTDDIDLPASYKRLRSTLDTFRERGYESLIDWRFGNKLAAKVSDGISESMLLELIGNPNQHDDVIISKVYNEWALKNEYKTIDPATVGVHRRKNYYQLQGQREGNSAWYNTYGKIIHRNRPSAPMLLLGSDDNDLDLYFQDERKGKTNHYFRYKLIVVMDAYNDYILGYSYGESVTVDLIKAAYLDAMHHIKSLTGSWYLPDQLQTDRWAIDKDLKGPLATFYKSMATYTPASLKVARSKYIERAFGTTWHQLLKMYPNYAGTNITSQFRINRDNLELQKKNFPTIKEGLQYIEDFINRLRMLPDAKTNKPKQQQWLEAFQNNELSQQHRISDARMLNLFGQAHTHTHTITNGGLKVTFDGQLFTYDIPDDLPTMG